MKNRIDHIRQGKVQIRDIVGWFVFVVCILIASFLVGANVGQVSVTNCTNKALSKCAVNICGRQHSISTLLPGDSRQVLFWITGDSGYRVTYCMGDAGHEFVSEEAGYVCAGFGSFGKPDSIKIYDDRIEFSDSKANKVDVLSIHKSR